jgi:hypothetical protein
MIGGSLPGWNANLIKVGSAFKLPILCHRGDGSSPQALLVRTTANLFQQKNPLIGSKSNNIIYRVHGSVLALGLKLMQPTQYPSQFGESCNAVHIAVIALARLRVMLRCFVLNKKGEAYIVYRILW